MKPGWRGTHLRGLLPGEPTVCEDEICVLLVLCYCVMYIGNPGRQAINNLFIPG